MLPYPSIDPVAFKIGPFAVRWYGIAYLIGFLASWWLVKRQILSELYLSNRELTCPSGRKKGETGLNDNGKPEHTKDRAERELRLLESLVTWLVMGVIVGGRLGYCLLYNLPYYLSHPIEAFATWHGGMSFHGGLLGAITGGIIFAKRHQEPFLKWADRFVFTVPIGLFFGRIANFINGELFGRASSVPWAMVFPMGGNIPRHPSQLYEAILEGPVLFGILMYIKKRRNAVLRNNEQSLIKGSPKGIDGYGGALGIFLISYGIIRFFVEFFREPDPQLGFIAFNWLTMGQLLSLLMAIGGYILLKSCTANLYHV